MTSRQSARVLVSLLLLLLFGTGDATAQEKKGTPKPEMKGLSVLGAARGTNLTVVVFGENFTTPTITASNPKITLAKVSPPEETKEDSEKQRGKQKITLEVQIAPDCPTEPSHQLLLSQDEHKVTRTFVVWEAVAAEPALKRPCNTFREAMPIAGDSVAVTAFLEGGDQPDLFRLDAKAKGEAWDITLVSFRAGSQMDGVLRVRDSKGLPLAFVSGDENKDRVLRFVAPATGAFYIEVSDTEGRGGRQMQYRLVVRRGK